MHFSNTLSVLFIGLAVASPLMVRDPQDSFPPSDLLLPGQGGDSGGVDPGFTPPAPGRGNQNFPPSDLLLPGQGGDSSGVDPGFTPPAPGRGNKNPPASDLLLPGQGGNSGGVDPDFTPPAPPSRGPKNSQGFTQENCDNIRKNFNKEFATQFGC